MFSVEGEIDRPIGTLLGQASFPALDCPNNLFCTGLLPVRSKQQCGTVPGGWIAPRTTSPNHIPKILTGRELPGNLSTPKHAPSFQSLKNKNQMTDLAPPQGYTQNNSVTEWTQGGSRIHPPTLQHICTGTTQPHLKIHPPSFTHQWATTSVAHPW